MLADTRNIDGCTTANQRSLDERPEGDIPDEGGAGVPVRRIGLEQEFFLVEQTGVLCDLADLFLRRCREAAQAEGFDPRCFKPECVKSLVEITTPPSSDLANLAKNYLSNLNLALEVGAELGLELYPLATYPLPIRPMVRNDPGYRVQARTIGHDRFLHAGRCAGVHLHLELPAGIVWPDMKTALDAPVAAQEELLDLYNLATALDPALVALTRACPFYEGRADAFAARTVHYRGMLGLDGLYADLQEVGALSPYATRVEDLIDHQVERYKAWFAAMDLAGVDRRLFASTEGNLHRASWNPIRLNHHGTVEIRSMDANFPEVILAVCALICGAVDRLRREHLRVRPTRQVRSLEVDGDNLLVPHFSYLRGELLGAAVTHGVLDERIEAYLDSFVRLASAYVEEPKLVESLRCAGRGYKTTEVEVLRPISPFETDVSREQGLWLVQRSCRRLREQVSSLRRGHHRARQNGGHEKSTGGEPTSLEAFRQHPDYRDAASNPERASWSQRRR
jgi:gamma-glutamyl:cysteine ligase YbdK (ATP-grasp superfamily)